MTAMYVTYAVSFVAGVAGTVRLVETGHPWFAVLVAAMTASLNFTVKKR